VTRVVSLVPSLTEAIAVTLPGILVGATDYCTHPEGLDVPRVGGSKYPRIDDIRALEPDVVVMNMEENRRADADELAAQGIQVHVTYPRTVDAAISELGTMLRALGARAEPEWLRRARDQWAKPRPEPERTAIVPVWRRPWIVAGGDTFTSDVLRRLGVRNLYDDPDDRYPRPGIEELRAKRPDLVILPDEPYLFTEDDGPEAFPGQRCVLVSGRYLTWYGPSLADARAALEARIRESSSG
jgi:ABC-type Fe3+-hydroxamate transport system substrate-binding protein